MEAGLSIHNAIEHLLCHPCMQPKRKGYRLVCPICDSFWDTESCAYEYVYTGEYSVKRDHYDPHIGELKVSSFTRWLSLLNINLSEHVVCEVGFGGGHCLTYLNSQAKVTYGIEAVQENIDNAVKMGVPASQLMLVGKQPKVLAEPVSLWVFQDSLEHILDIRPFLQWLAENSAADSFMLIVAPDASSWSRKVMGKYWPHKIPDHQFHWSGIGLEFLLGQFGFNVDARFNPVKYISSRMLLNHLERTGLRWLFKPLQRITPAVDFWFNIGEMGLLLERKK